MKFLAFVLFCALSVGASAQTHESMLWTQVGATGKVVKKLDWAFELDARFDRYGMATFFPQAGFEYKVKKWFRPSIEYRYITEKNKFGNYKGAHRLNLNANFKFKYERFGFSSRIRFQNGVEEFNPGSNYNSDFDQAIRLKFGVNYDIRKSMFIPLFASEFFYNPAVGVDGRQFNKIRITAGTKVELKGPNVLSVKYQLNKKFNDFESGYRHVLSLAYEYKFKN